MSDQDNPPPIGRPQIYAGLLLLAFLAQCVWLSRHAPLEPSEQAFASPGPRVAGFVASPAVDPERSPLIYRIAQLPVHAGMVPPFDYAGPMYSRRGLLRLPFCVIGVLLGASVWYCSRRLYGNSGGYFALALYCFSPPAVRMASRVGPEVLAAWGFFGVVFFAMASAHTLYALPQTLPWRTRWRRPFLMGIALGAAVATQYTAWLALPLALAFVLYLAPERRAEGAGMVALGGAIAAVILVLAFAFDRGRLAVALATAELWSSPVRWSMPAPSYPLLLGLVAAALLTWLAWRRARWFGNTAVLVAAGVAAAVEPVAALPFAFMFCAGVWADLLETSLRRLVLAVGVGLLVVNAAIGLARLG